MSVKTIKTDDIVSLYFSDNEFEKLITILNCFFMFIYILILGVADVFTCTFMDSLSHLHSLHFKYIYQKYLEIISYCRKKIFDFLFYYSYLYFKFGLLFCQKKFFVCIIYLNRPCRYLADPPFY